jgi:hypothetical protein
MIDQTLQDRLPDLSKEAGRCQDRLPDLSKEAGRCQTRTSRRRGLRKNTFKTAIFAILSIAILLFAIGAYASSIWQSDSDSAQNNLAVGSLIVTIDESTFTSGAGITAGGPYSGSKKIEMVSSGTYPGIVRIALITQIKDDSGTEEILLDSSKVTLLGLNPDWVLGDDGYYYYTKVIEPAATITFCDNVTLGTLATEYAGANLAIDVLSEASYITDGSYPHTLAWWNLGPADIGTTPIEAIRATLKGAIDTYVALNW